MSHYDLSEAYRKLAAMIRFGTITGVDLSDATAPRVTCTCGGLDTDMLPWHAMRAGKTVHWSAPTIGEQVIVFAPGGETTLGFVLGGFYSSNNPAPSTDPNVDMTQYPDGSTVQYDSAAHTMTLTVLGNGSAVVNVAGGSVTLNSENFAVNGNLAVSENVSVGNGATGTFTSFDGQTVVVQDGIILSIG